MSSLAIRGLQDEWAPRCADRALGAEGDHRCRYREAVDTYPVLSFVDDFFEAVYEHMKFVGLDDEIENRILHTHSERLAHFCYSAEPPFPLGCIGGHVVGEDEVHRQSACTMYGRYEGRSPRKARARITAWMLNTRP